jgi:hypothetical protein
MSYAAPKIDKIVMSPTKTEIPVGSDSVALTVKASGSNLEYEWILQGVGSLQEPTTKPAVFFIPPESIDKGAVQVMISIVVSDDQGQEATESIIFKIVTNDDKHIQVPSSDKRIPNQDNYLTIDINDETDIPEWVDSRSVSYTHEGACRESGQEEKWEGIFWGKVRFAGSRSEDAGYVYYTLCQGTSVIKAWVLPPGNTNPKTPAEKYRCLRHYAFDRNYCFALQSSAKKASIKSSNCYEEPAMAHWIRTLKEKRKLTNFMLGKPYGNGWVVYWLPDSQSNRVCDCKGEYRRL